MSILVSFLLAVPALAVRSDTCADELRAAEEALAAARAEHEALMVDLQRHGLSDAAPDEAGQGEGELWSMASAWSRGCAGVDREGERGLVLVI